MKIENGVITNQGRQIGTTAKEWNKETKQMGLMVVVGCFVKWFELDEPDLLAKIADFARDYEHGGPQREIDEAMVQEESPMDEGEE